MSSQIEVIRNKVLRTTFVTRLMLSHFRRLCSSGMEGGPNTYDNSLEVSCLADMKSVYILEEERCLQEFFPAPLSFQSNGQREVISD